MSEWSRYRAASYHLVLSIAVFLLPAGLILVAWYPDFFFAIDGGWQGTRILLAAHLVAGPALTLAVYRAGKKGLLLDLFCISTFQLACLAAGLYVIYKERPLYFVYYDRSFYSVNSSTFSRFESEAPRAGQLGGRAPLFVDVSIPDNPLDEAALRESLYQDEIPLWAHGPGYRPLEENIGQIVGEAYEFAFFEGVSESRALKVWLAQRGGRANEFAVYPVIARYGSPLLAIRKRDQEIMGIFNPDTMRPEPTF